MNRAMTEEKMHMKNTANASDLVSITGLPRTNFCKYKQLTSSTPMDDKFTSTRNLFHSD